MCFVDSFYDGKPHISVEIMSIWAEMLFYKY